MQTATLGGNARLALEPLPTVLTGRVPFRLSRYAHALLLFFWIAWQVSEGVGVMLEAQEELAGWCVISGRNKLFSVCLPTVDFGGVGGLSDTVDGSLPLA